MEKAWLIGALIVPRTIGATESGTANKTWLMSMEYTAALAGCRTPGFWTGGIQTLSASLGTDAMGSACPDAGAAGAGQASGGGIACKICVENISSISSSTS